MAELEQACVCEVDTGGSWRKGEFVVWSDLLVFVEAILVWFGLLVVVMAIAAGVLAAQHMPPEAMTVRAANLIEAPAFHHAAVITVYLVMLFFFARVANRVADGSLGARFRAIPWQTLAIALLTGMALAVLVPLLTNLLTQYRLIELKPTRSEMRLVPRSTAEWAMAVAAIGIMAPLTEELYFRGLLLGWLRKRMGVIAAIAVSGVLFGLAHFAFLEHQGAAGWYVTGVVTAIGFLTAAAAVRTGSLWTSFAIHGGYNTMLISLPMLQTLLR